MKNIVEIKRNALALIAKVEFFFPDYQNNDEFNLICEGMSGYQINKYLDKYRLTKINETRYRSCDDFVNTYTLDIVTALERLFQERVNDNKLETLKCKDPERIYELHQRDKTVWFNDFTSHFM